MPLFSSYLPPKTILSEHSSELQRVEGHSPGASACVSMAEQPRQHGTLTWPLERLTGLCGSSASRIGVVEDDNTDASIAYIVGLLRIAQLAVGVTPHVRNLLSTHVETFDETSGAVRPIRRQFPVRTVRAHGERPTIRVTLDDNRVWQRADFTGNSTQH